MDTNGNTGHAGPTVFGAPVTPGQVCLFPAGTSKAAALLQLVAAVATHAGVSDHEVLRGAVFDRESKGSTGIGSGVAIPHVRTGALRQSVLGIGVSRTGLDYGAVDGKPVHLLVFFATPAEGNEEYLSLLRQVMIALRGTGLKRKLMECASREDVVAALQR